MKEKIDASKLRESGEYRSLPNFETKTLPTFITKTDEAQGIIEQVVAVIGNIDDGDDIIESGAFSKSIQENGRRVRVLDNHNSYSINNVIGKPLWMREIGRDQLPENVLSYAPSATGGLLVATQYAMKTENGRNAFNLISGGFVPESSIGYDPITTSYSEVEESGTSKNVRHLKEVRLWEYSNVLWGMNPATSVVSAKSMEEQETMDNDEKAVTAFQNLPLAPRDREWDSDAAESRLRKWASSDESGDKDKMDWAKYSKAFFYSDPENDEDFAGYKLPYVDVVDGKLEAVPKGIFAVAGVLQGARRGADIPETEQDRIKGQVNRYYAKMREEFDDDGIVAPWDKGKSRDENMEESKTYSMPMFGDYLQGCVHKTFTNICDDSYIGGNMNRDQRIAMSNLIGDMLDMFTNQCPRDIYEMPSHNDYGYAVMEIEDIIREVKAGRAISKANAARIRATIDQIHAAATALEQMLESALPPENSDDEEMAAHEEDEEDKSQKQAGPSDGTLTEVELLRMQIEQFMLVTQ